MSLASLHCPNCNSSEHKEQRRYTIKTGDERTIYECITCHSYFSETNGTPLAGLRRELSFIITVLENMENEF